MKPQIKEMWLEALRSGHYKQGHVFLNNEGKHCCLGVLCDIYMHTEDKGAWLSRISSYDPEPPLEFFAHVRDYGDAHVLPPKVNEWAELDEADLNVLVELNDGRDPVIDQKNNLTVYPGAPRHSFTKIAEWIEAYL